ncbi:hypothetical protein, partial [Salmonella sp. s57610]
GPEPDHGHVFGKLKRVTTDLNKEGEGSKYQRSSSMPNTPATPGTPTTPSPTGARKDNVWRSVFHPGSNLATKGIGAQKFDKPNPNTPTVYDWLYSDDTKSTYR